MDATAAASSPLWSTAVPTFVTDAGKRLIGWNAPLAASLGYCASEVLGRPCYEVLRGTNLRGRPVCKESCGVFRAAESGRLPSSFTLLVRKYPDDLVRAEMSCMAVWDGTGSRPALFHLLRLPPSARKSATLESLSRREKEVLRLLVRGIGVKDISVRFAVSIATIRAHVRGVHRKLGVHSQIEAAGVAFAAGLV